MRKAVVALLLICTAAACSKKEDPLSSLPDLKAVRANLAFTCTHEADHLPPLDPQADQLFQYARYLEKKAGAKNFDDVARYYRIAAAHGHYKANHNLQVLVSQGMASSPDPEKESVDLAMQLVKENVPSGYYDIGHYLLNGYGLKQDDDAARRYIRKAADLGNADAQYYIGELLAPADMAPEIARQMRQCAAEQGHAVAGNLLGIDLKNSGRYEEAVEGYQMSVAAGSAGSALSLSAGFDGPAKGDPLAYLALEKDPERSRRYEVIEKFIDRNEDNNPKVPDIDKIVPLPPAKLPPWDGTFQWEKERAAAVPPQKPSDELIKRLSEEKHLDPATGLPLAQPEHVSQTDSAPPAKSRLPVGTVAQTGQSCPESGLWRANLAKGMIADTEWRFRKGTELPLLTVYRPRVFAWLDGWLGVRKQTLQVTWTLIDYIAEA